MGIRTGEQFLAGLRDGRAVWIDGTRVDDVTAHPELQGCAREIAAYYDLQHQEEYRDLFTIKSPTTGEPVSRAYQTPETSEDLIRWREMIETVMRLNGGTMGRLPEYMATIMVGLYDVRGLLAEENLEYAPRIEAYFEYIRDNDLSLTHSFADAPRDARIPRTEFENLRVVEEREDGIVVRGVKSVASLAPFADEYLSLAPNRPGLLASEIAYFATPVNTPGLRIYCRPSVAKPASDDHPLSSRFDEQDAWIVFDDVFVPMERVFYLHKTEGHRDLLGQMLVWSFFHILTRMAVKAEVLSGVGTAITDYLARDNMATQLSRVELYSYAETLRAFVRSAELDPVHTVSGYLAPNPTFVTMGRIHAVEQMPRMLQIVRELSGSGLLMAPGVPDFANEQIRADVERYLVGVDTLAPERFQLLKLAREYTSEAFGARQLLFEMHNAGAHLTTKQKMAATYDASEHVALAKRLAGVKSSG